MGIDIVDDIFEILNTFPIEERFGLVSQMSRCSVSIPNNIAKGSARSNKSFANFIDISLGSSFELGTQLIIAYNRNYITKEKLNLIEDKTEEFQ